MHACHTLGACACQAHHARGVQHAQASTWTARAVQSGMAGQEHTTAEVGIMPQDSLEHRANMLIRNPSAVGVKPSAVIVLAAARAHCSGSPPAQSLSLSAIRVVEGACCLHVDACSLQEPLMT